MLSILNMEEAKETENAHTEEYDICTVEGVNCICWKFSDIEDNSAKASKRRREVKQTVGHKYLDVPLLDSKQGEKGKVFCDVILFSNNIEQWEDVLTAHYTSLGYTTETKTLSGGHQTNWKDGENIVVALSFWPQSNKLMLQPGQQVEARITEWLATFPNLKESVMSGKPHAEVDIVDVATQQQPDASSGDGEMHVKPSINGSESEAIAGLPTDSTDSHQVESSSHETAKLVVKLPAKPIINEVLCFVQNKVQTVPKDTLAQVCADFYDFKVINAAKELLYTTVSAKTRFRSRRGNDRSVQSMHDIITAFLEMEVTNAPVFVARHLAELPPISIDSMDSLKVLSEISEMKAQMSMITKGHQELLDLVKEDQSKQRSGVSIPTRETDTQSAGLSLLKEMAAAEVTFLCDTETDEQVSHHDDGSIADSEQSEYDEHVPQDTSPFVYPSRVFRRSRDKPQPPSSKGGLYSDVAGSAPPPASRRQPPPTLQPPRKQPHRRNEVLVGSGSHGLKAVPPKNTVVFGTGSHSLKAVTGRHEQPQTQRQCTGLFVSRLKPKTTCDHVINHVWNVTGYDVDVERLRTRYEGYCSFFIRCNKSMRGNLLQPDLWPKDTLVKPFYT